MRFTAAVLVLLASVSLSRLAHADTYFTYTGNVLVNGYSEVGTYNDTTRTNYNNTPAATSVTIGEAVSPVFGTSFYIQSFQIDLPDGGLSNFDFQDVYLGYDNCAYDSTGCYANVEFDFDYLASGPLPTPDLLVSGGRNAILQNVDTGYYFNDSIVFDGDLNMATTPEPASFALLGTGLLGIAGALQRRRTKASAV